jgi:hypothetical protein
MQIDEVYRIAFDAFKNALDQTLTTDAMDVSIAPKFRRGMLIMKPEDAAQQPKEMELDVFFKKIVAVRNNLRVLEQKINASKLSEAEKLELDGYITKSYGSLTSFNILFRDQEDRFVGQRGSE